MKIPGALRWLRLNTLFRHPRAVEVDHKLMKFHTEKRSALQELVGFPYSLHHENMRKIWRRIIVHINLEIWIKGVVPLQ